MNSGLIVATRSESELASVLAHEIAHVTQRHIVRAIDHANRSSLPALAGVLAAVIIGTRSIEAGQAAAAAVIGSTAQRQINFTRENEMEADRVGIRMLAAAGFDPLGMAGVFEKLQADARYSQRPPEFLSTHPVTTNRIAEARDRAARLPYRQARERRGVLPRTRQAAGRYRARPASGCWIGSSMNAHPATPRMRPRTSSGRRSRW